VLGFIVFGFCYVSAFRGFDDIQHFTKIGGGKACLNGKLVSDIDDRD